MLIILFGLAGSGKNYVGQLISKHFPTYYFWDADEILPIEMQECINFKQTFTQDMRDNFTQLILKEIAILQSTHSNLIVSQALYKEKNRNQILKNFPDALFIHVRAKKDIILQRLKVRDNWVSESYATKIATYFEQPVLSHYVLNNDNNDEDTLKQFIEITNWK